jgi:hypothetical protein
MSRKTAVVPVALPLAMVPVGCGRSCDAPTVYFYSGQTQNLVGPLPQRLNKRAGVHIDGSLAALVPLPLSGVLTFVPVVRHGTPT